LLSYDEARSISRRGELTIGGGAQSSADRGTCDGGDGEHRNQHQAAYGGGVSFHFHFRWLALTSS
jgi:hypothetical protein